MFAIFNEFLLKIQFEQYFFRVQHCQHFGVVFGVIKPGQDENKKIVFACSMARAVWTYFHRLVHFSTGSFQLISENLKNEPRYLEPQFTQFSTHLLRQNMFGAGPVDWEALRKEKENYFKRPKSYTNEDGKNFFRNLYLYDNMDFSIFFH